MEFKKRDLLIKENTSEDSIVKKVLDKIGKIKDRAVSEVKETRALIKILTHAVKSYSKNREFDLNNEDKKFIKEQSVDVVRNVILVIVGIIPLPIPLTPFLIIFGNKIGIDLVPKEQKIPDKGQSKKLKESKLNIIITEEQAELLEENFNRGMEIINKLCKNQRTDKPFCRLKDLYNELSGDPKTELETAIEMLNGYFKYKNVGLFPVIVELALKDIGRTVYYLKTLAEFLDDRSFDRTVVKKSLKRFKNVKEMPPNREELEDLLTKARYLEHQKYEQSFEGDYFKKNQTRLKLDYKCGDDTKDTLFEILTKIGSEEQTIDTVFNSVTNCIQKSLTQGTYYLKADLTTKQDLKCSGETIFPSDTHFEVKKMDPFIDSYLSEFFSIFKQTELISFKPEYVSVYNELIDRIFEWLLNNPSANEYLEKVKSQMGGIIYEYNVIVPIEYIDMYWSNKGQRGCDERRLSIRFKIKDSVNEIKTYRFKNSEELTPFTLKVTSNQKDKVICI